MRALQFLSTVFALTACAHVATATKPITSGTTSIQRSTRAGSNYISTTTSLPNNRIFVTRNVMSSYNRGAAHPNSWFQTTNQDLETGKNLQLKDLFKPGYLKAMSKSAVAQLNQTMPDPDPKWIKEGAGAKVSNFKAYAVTQKGIELNFGEYQVGPHATGLQSIVVPWSDLKPFIKEGSAIARYAK